MDTNQKSTEGSGRDLGREGAGSSLGKDTQKTSSQQSGSASTGGVQGSSAAGSSGSLGSSTGGAGTGAGMGGATGGVSSATAVQRGGNGAAGMHANSIDENIERGKQNLHRSIDQAADAAQPLVDRLASSAHAGVDRMSSALSGVGQTVSEKSHQLRDAYGEYLDSGRDYIRMKPATAVAGAFVAGWLLAKIFSGSRRD